MSAIFTTNEHFHSNCTVNDLDPYEGHSTKIPLYVNNGGRFKSVSLHVTNKERFFCKVRTSTIPTYKKAMLHQYRKKRKTNCKGRYITVLWPSHLPWSQPLKLERQQDASCCLAFGFAPAFALPFAAACNKNNPRESGQAETYTMLN